MSKAGALDGKVGVVGSVYNLTLTPFAFVLFSVNSAQPLRAQPGPRGSTTAMSVTDFSGVGPEINGPRVNDCLLLGQ